MTDTLSLRATTGLPLYRRIQADLRARMEQGELAPGSQVETEQELRARYGVSRATIRQALGGLIAEGLLEIRRGLGTYVRARPVEHVMGGFYTFSREIERHGLTPGTRALGVRVEPADEHVATALGLAVGAPVVALSRLRLADDQPVVAETSWLPADRFPGLEGFDFGRVRLYDTLITRYGVRPVRAHEAFEPVLLTASEARLLDRRRGDPALRVERTAFDTDGTIVEYCRSTVRSDRYRYSVELREP
jgi:GntR family transcriptional regulator